MAPADLLTLGTGFVLGLRHSLEPDHLAAVAQLASAEPRTRRGLAFGLLWGAGHGAALLILGAAVLALGVRLPPRCEQASEVAVGITLVGLALWRLHALVTAEHEHVHAHPCGVVHTHSHRHRAGHRHTHGTVLTGFLHGVAGALAVIALLPLASSPGAGLLALLAFGCGSMMSMGLFGLVAGRAYAALASPTLTTWRRAAVAATAVSGLAMGVLWIARSL